MTGEMGMNVLAQIAAVLLGLVGGALLLIGLSLVPYWQSLDPSAFTQWFGANVHFFAGTMKPLGFSTTAVTLLATGLAWWKKLPTRFWLAGASVGVLIMLVTFPLYFKDTNAALAAASAGAALAGSAMTAAEAANELVRWQLMHWVRTIAAIAGCFCAVRAGYARSA